MKTLTGAEIVIECLKEQEVDTVFGYPGGTILNIYDALYKHQNEITHILTSHEQGAVSYTHLDVYKRQPVYCCISSKKELEKCLLKQNEVYR